MDNPESYQPLLVTIDVALREAFPLLDVKVLSALSERILGDLQEQGAIVELHDCTLIDCGEPALFGTTRCPTHQEAT